MKNKWDESDLFTEIPKIEQKYLSSLPKEEDCIICSPILLSRKWRR